MKTFFISGIDTDCGKTYITGLLAKQLHNHQHRVLTHKPIQTGCTGSIADDILSHRQLMGIPPTAADTLGQTCPYLFPFPASPHLAAELAGQTININIINQSIADLATQQICDILLIEGAGGLMVPLTRNYSTLDFIIQQQHPLILVLSSRLGSINHSLLSLMACKTHHLSPVIIIYNQFPDDDSSIANDSYQFLQQWCVKHFSNSLFVHHNQLHHPDIIAYLTSSQA